MRARPLSSDFSPLLGAAGRLRCARRRAACFLASARSLLALALLVGCASNPYRGDLPSAEQVATWPRGAPVDLTTMSGSAIRGELIAVAPGGDVLVLAGERLLRVPLGDVRRMRVFAWASGERELAALTVLGTLSTISHGYFLVFSLPIWLATGIPLTYVESRGGLLDVPGVDVATLRPWARFPQGLPPGVDACALVHGAACPPPAASGPAPTP